MADQNSKTQKVRLRSITTLMERCAARKSGSENITSMTSCQKKNTILPLFPIPSNQTLNQNNLNSVDEDVLYNLIKRLIDIRKENLSVLKEKIALENERFEYDKMFAKKIQILTPMLGSFLRCPKLADLSLETDTTRKLPDELIKTMLEQGIQKFITKEEIKEEDISPASE